MGQVRSDDLAFTTKHAFMQAARYQPLFCQASG